MKTLKHKGRNAFLFVDNNNHITMHLECHIDSGQITYQSEHVHHIISEDIEDYEECDSTFALSQLNFALSEILGNSTRINKL